MEQNKTAQLGWIASIAAAVETFLFAIFLVAALRFPEFNYLSYLVCFLLAPTYIVMAAALHASAPDEKKTFTRVALAFSVIYAVFCTMTYYVQLVFVRPNSLILPKELLRLFFFTSGTFIFSLDMLGYAFLCLSTLFASAVFDLKKEKWPKVFYIINGVLFLPTLVFPALPFAQDSGASMQPSDIFGTFALLFWCFIFVPLSVMTASYFSKIRGKA